MGEAPERRGKEKIVWPKSRRDTWQFYDEGGKLRKVEASRHRSIRDYIHTVIVLGGLVFWAGFYFFALKANADETKENKIEIEKIKPRIEALKISDAVQKEIMPRIENKVNKIDEKLDRFFREMRGSRRRSRSPRPARRADGP